MFHSRTHYVPLQIIRANKFSIALIPSERAGSEQHLTEISGGPTARLKLLDNHKLKSFCLITSSMN